MTENSAIPDAAELARERDALRRGLGRSRLAALAVLLIAAALGSAAVAAALRAQSNAVEARERLWESLVSQARAERLSGEVGGRTKALKAIREAAAIRPTGELRDEAIAALALIDLEVVDRWPGYPERALRAEFSPDLTYYAIDHGRIMNVFRTDTRERIMHHIKLPTLSIPSWVPMHPEHLLFSPDEKLLAGMYWGGFVLVWDVEQGKEIWRDRIGESDPNICGLSFDAASEKLAVATPSESCARIYAARTGEVLQHFDTSSSATKIALSPDGKVLAWADSALRVRALEGGEQMLTESLPSHAMELRWSPDGERVAAGCYGGELWIVDLDTGYVLDCDTSSSVIHGMDYSPDGRTIMATAWDGATRFWDAHQGTLRLVTHEANGQRFDRSGERIGFIRVFAELGIWEFSNSSIHRGFGTGTRAELEGFRGLDISPDNRWIVASSRDFYARSIWDRETGKVCSKGETMGMSSLFGPEGRWIYGQDREGLNRWPVEESDGHLALGEPERIEGSIGSIYDLNRSADRKWATTRDAEGAGYRIELGDAPKLEKIVEGLPEDARIAAFTQSSDRRWGVTSHWTARSTELWDLNKGRRHSELDVFGGYASFLPDGRLAVASQRGLALWDATTWKRQALFPFEASTSLPCLLGFTPDGRYISYSNTQSTIRLIDSKTLKAAATFANPTPGRLYSHRLSDDGRFLLTSSKKHLDLWDLPAVERELDALGLKIGQQNPARASGIANTQFTPTAAAIFASVILLAAIGFGLYSMLYQRRLIQRFDAQYATLERTQKELVQSEKMKALGTLSAGVAHDFKNLLSVVRLSNDLIRRDAGDREDIIEEVDAIGNAVVQGDQVVKAMLGYSRGGDGGAASVDVPDVIDGTVALLGQQFLSGVRLQLDIDRDLPPVDIPQGALEQMLLNLVVNASEAMGGKGQLGISASVSTGADASDPVLRPRDAEKYIAVRVADDGPGMDGETLGRIFEPFFTTKTIGAEKGTGLGLATVYKIARDNGLGLAAFSDPGAGAVFEVQLPC